MKKISSLFTVIIIVLLFTNTAFADMLPSIDAVLSNPEFYSGKVEVSDDLSAFDPNNLIDIETADLGDYKTIVLERKVPEKEFTELDSGYPSPNYLRDFPDDFKGVDMGIPRIWVRCDMMEMFPDDMKAHSLSEADMIIIAEDEYFWTGTLTVTDFSHTTDEEIPNFDNIEELQKYILEHQPIVTGIKYYPKFSSFQMINLYETNNYGCIPMDCNYYDSKRFASNPEAADIQMNIEDLADLKEKMNAGLSDIASDNLNEMDFVPASKISFWQSCLNFEEYTSAAFSVEDYIWEIAEELKTHDPSEENQAAYDMIIKSRDLQTLLSFANFCNYSGFDTSISLIKTLKQYMPATDNEWIESALRSFIEELLY